MFPRRDPLRTILNRRGDTNGDDGGIDGDAGDDGDALEVFLEVSRPMRKLDFFFSRPILRAMAVSAPFSILCRSAPCITPWFSRCPVDTKRHQLKGGEVGGLTWQCCQYCEID